MAAAATSMTTTTHHHQQAGGGEPSTSDSTTSVSPMRVDYAPSPNTSSAALGRANQLRVQSLLRKLLVELNECARIDTVRVLRKTMRELDYELSWLAQVDLLETIERVLRENADSSRDVQTTTTATTTTSQQQSSWRLVHDCTQLLIESLESFERALDEQLVDSIVPLVVLNLGHLRSEVRRASLLLLNVLFNNQPQQQSHNKQQTSSADSAPSRFDSTLKLFIDYGLANTRHKSAQRGAILSLPLLMNERLVKRENLQPLIECLASLLVDANNEQLFYSLYLALQRLHTMMGTERFQRALRQCEPAALLLYKQAASRNNSLATNSNNSCDDAMMNHRKMSLHQNCATVIANHQADDVPEESGDSKQQHVTFGGESRDEPSHTTTQQVEVGEEKLCEQDGRGESPSRSSSSSNESSSSLPQFTGPEQRMMTQFVSEQRQLWSSDVSSTCSSDAHLVNPAHYMTRAALAGRPLENFDQIHHVDHSNVSSLAINDFGPICNTPITEYNTPLHDHHNAASSLTNSLFMDDLHHQSPVLGSTELKFGIFPRHLIELALGASPRLADRHEAMQEMMCIIRESPVNHLAILMTYFDSFLEQFLARIMVTQQQNDAQSAANRHNTQQCQGANKRTSVNNQQPVVGSGGDFKLELIAIDMIETIVVKTKVSTMHYIRPLVSLLLRTMASAERRSRSVALTALVRDNTCRVLHKMMAYLPPQHVIDAVLEHKHSRSVLVREECINRVTGAMLEYDRNEFNLTKLCYHVLPLLADHEQSVRLASLECIATLAHALGPERIGSLLTAAEAVQTGCDYDGLLDAISARLERHTLPRCLSNGAIRHVLRPFLAGGSSPAPLVGHPEQRAADVRWVLEAPSTHQHLVSTSNLLADDHDAHDHQHHHRPGVYSPPTMDELRRQQRRRRSSVGVLAHLAGAAGQDEMDAMSHEHHHHHHHQHHHHQQQHNSGELDEQRRQTSRRSSSTSDQANATLQQQQQHEPDSGLNPAREEQRKQDIEEGQRRIETRDTCECNAHGARNEVTNDNERFNSTQVKLSTNKQRLQKQYSTTTNNTQPPIHRSKRSNSQESFSSTDTNKILFQYYLGKFRQSLADTPSNRAVLPSDSIIYTDINQAYELSRHQSRFQQTSFDYEPGSVGRVPNSTSSASIGPAVAQAVGPPTRRRSDKMNSQASQQQQLIARGSTHESARVQHNSSPPTSGSSSASNSPQTVMEAAAATSTSNIQHRRQSTATSRRSSQTEINNKLRRSPSESSVQRRRSSQNNSSQSAETQSTKPPATDTTGRRKSFVAQSEGATNQSKDADLAQVNTRHRSESAATSAESDTSTTITTTSEAHRNTQAQHSSGSDGRRRTSRRSTGATSSSNDNTHQSQQRSTSRQSDQSNEEVRRDGSNRRQDEGRDRAIRRRASRSQPPPVRVHRVAQSNAAMPSHKVTNGTLNHRDNDDKHDDDDDDDDDNEDDLDSFKVAAATGLRRAVSVSPSLSNSINIRHILENVADIEGPFADAPLALKVALDALDSPCWSTKVEGILALIRLTTFHQSHVLADGHLHEIVAKTADETRNLRSTVARAAIYALGDYCAKLKRLIDCELDLIVRALLSKSIENATFIRDDIKRALSQMVDNLTPWRLAQSLINHGSQHKSQNVRKMSSQFIAMLVERMGPAKCLVGAREISSSLIPTAARFAQDNSPHTRYYGRLILSKLFLHNSFDRLLRRNLTSTLYRSTIGIIESVKRRGPGEMPIDSR